MIFSQLARRDAEFDSRNIPVLVLHRCDEHWLFDIHIVTRKTDYFVHERIGHAYDPAEQRFGFRLAHGIAKLMADQPGCFVCYSDRFGELQRIDSAGLRMKIDRFEPRGKRRSGAAKAGVGNQRSLLAAADAFIQGKPASMNRKTLRMGTFRATKAFRPFDVVQRLNAEFLRIQQAVDCFECSIQNAHHQSERNKCSYFIITNICSVYKNFLEIFVM